jgi:gluconolactonase
MKPELVVTAPAHEGPVYRAGEDALYVTSVPRREPDGPADPVVDILRIQLDGERFPRPQEAVSVVRERATVANGMTLDPAGRLLVCEQGSFTEPAAIAVLDPDTGARSTLVDGWRGLPLNSPNDIAVAPDGAVWFTDPTYGHLQGFRPASATGDLVYRHDPATGETVPVADDLDKPNGIALSPDGRVLYVADSGADHQPHSFDVARPHHVLAYDVLDGRRLTGRRLFAVVTPGAPDGLKVDGAGRVYVSCHSGVLVHSPDGELLEEIELPGAVNFTFGGRDGRLLLITADTAIWAARLDSQAVSTSKG